MNQLSQAKFLFAVWKFPVISTCADYAEHGNAIWALIDQRSFSLADRTFLEDFSFFYNLQLLLYDMLGGSLWSIPWKTVNVKSFSPIAEYEPQANRP